MKTRFTLLAMAAMMAAAIGFNCSCAKEETKEDEVLTSVGELLDGAVGEKLYMVFITPGEFSSEYSENDGEHTSIALAQDGSGETFEFKWACKDIGRYGEAINFRADNGYLYNVTQFGQGGGRFTYVNLKGMFYIGRGTTMHPDKTQYYGGPFFTYHADFMGCTTDYIMVKFYAAK